jgi:3-phytase
VAVASQRRNDGMTTRGRLALRCAFVSGLLHHRRAVHRRRGYDAGDMHARASAVVLLLLAVASCGSPPPTEAPALLPVRATGVVPHDPDDPAIWVHPTDPRRSLILATDKVAAVGGLHVFDLDGHLRQSLAPLDRPNNVDVEYGLQSPAGPIDVAVVTERLQHRLRLFQVPADGGPVQDLAPAGLPVLEGQTGEAAEPMGIAVYKRPRDGAVFAIVAPKTGGGTDYLWQYHLTIAAEGPVARLVRRFGRFSGLGPQPGEAGEIEAVVVDDELGYVYYADERYGIRKWHADPEHPQAATELAVLGRTGYLGDREGLALHRRADGSGYLVSSDQVPGGSRLMIYSRGGGTGGPHEQPILHVVPTTADETDGLDVSSVPLPGFADGLLVMMNSTPRNFLLFAWSDVARRLRATASPR